MTNENNALEAEQALAAENKQLALTFGVSTVLGTAITYRKLRKGKSAPTANSTVLTTTLSSIVNSTSVPLKYEGDREDIALLTLTLTGTRALTNALTRHFDPVNGEINTKGEAFKKAVVYNTVSVGVGAATFVLERHLAKRLDLVKRAPQKNAGGKRKAAPKTPFSFADAKFRSL